MDNIQKMFVNYIQGRKAALFHPKREVMLTTSVPGTLDTGDILIEYPVET